MINKLTYEDVIQSYLYQIALIFRANTANELQNAWHELYEFNAYANEAYAYSKIPDIQKDIDPKVLETKILLTVKKSVAYTLEMYKDCDDFKKVLAKMHADFDTFSKLIAKE